MFALMGMYYHWASPSYLLEMPFHLFMTYWGELNAILGGKSEVDTDQSPDIAAFYAKYGSAIKRGARS